MTLGSLPAAAIPGADQGQAWERGLCSCLPAGSGRWAMATHQAVLLYLLLHLYACWMGMLCAGRRDGLLGVSAGMTGRRASSNPCLPARLSAFPRKCGVLLVAGSPLGHKLEKENFQEPLPRPVRSCLFPQPQHRQWVEAALQMGHSPQGNTPITRSRAGLGI